MKLSSFQKATHPNGFSLVEVTLALGIVSFALLAVVGLLPTGLKSIKNANEQAGAANSLAAIAHSLRNATSTDGTNFKWFFGGKTNSFVRGGSPPPPATWTNLNLDGKIAKPNDAPRLSARVDVLKAPGADHSPGEAVISVAWSAQSNPQWDANSKQWDKADGFVLSGIQFLPRQ